jgi:hypothetical protein
MTERQARSFASKRDSEVNATRVAAFFSPSTFHELNFSPSTYRCTDNIFFTDNISDPKFPCLHRNTRRILIAKIASANCFAERHTAILRAFVVSDAVTIHIAVEKKGPAWAARGPNKIEGS